MAIELTESTWPERLFSAAPSGSDHSLMSFPLPEASSRPSGPMARRPYVAGMVLSSAPSGSDHRLMAFLFPLLEASSRPSGVMASAPTKSESPLKVFTRAPSGRDQSLMLTVAHGVPAASRRPSGLIASELTAAVGCPGMVFSSAPSGNDHSLIAVSKLRPVPDPSPPPHEASSRPSGLMASDVPNVECPDRLFSRTPSGSDHTFMLLSSQPETSSRPSGLMASESLNIVGMVFSSAPSGSDQRSEERRVG